MTIDQPKERMSIIAQGFVYFQEEKKQFQSNNQISFSFLKELFILNVLETLLA